MSFDELVQWAGLGRIRASKVQSVLPLVEAAFTEVDESDPRYPALVEIENALLDGYVPEKLLMQLAETHAKPTAPAEDLESEYRRRAASLTDTEWRTVYYVHLERRLQEG